MKKAAVLFICCAIMVSIAAAQADYSGAYGFQLKVYVDKDSEIKPTNEERDQGRMGELTLYRVSGNKYKFWLYVNRGWPSYNLGTADGFIDVIGNRAVYTKKMEFTDNPCNISFAFEKGGVKLVQASGSNECAFGHNVYADGTYRLKNKRRLTDAGLEALYFDAPAFRVTEDKAFLYEDEAGTVITKQYFVRGDKVIAPADNGTFIYVEHIAPNGKFVYGWLKKTGVTAINSR